MQFIFMIAYFGISIVQMAAIIGGLESWFGLHWILATLLAFPATWIPIVGTALGIAGAIESWHWEWWQAVGLFILPLILSFVLGAGSFLLEKVRGY